MIINTIIVFTAWYALGFPEGWLWLMLGALVFDTFNVLIRPLRIKIPVIGLADIRKATEALGDVTTRKDGKPLMEVDAKDVTGGYL